LLLLSEEGTAKDLGILAAEHGCFKRQCDCFVTTRLPGQWFALKEVTNPLRRSNSVYGENGTLAESRAVNLMGKQFHAKAQSRQEKTYLSLRLCAFA